MTAKQVQFKVGKSSSAKAKKTNAETIVKLGQYRVIPNYVSEATCEKWTRSLLENHRDWIPFQEGAWAFPGSFYMSLEWGRAHHYFCHARAYNRRLKKLKGFLSTMLAATQYLVGPDGQRCAELRSRFENLGPYWCQAGFHIFNSSDSEASVQDSGQGRLIPPGPVHRDLEGLLPYPDAMFDRNTRAFTAVLMVEAPEQDGGLSIWRQRSPVRGKNKVSLKSELLDSVRMETGTLVVLDGFLPHQIQGYRSTAEKPLRITGVIHFLYRTIPYPHWEYWF